MGYLQWTKGTPLASSSVQTGPDLLVQPEVMQSYAVSGSDEIILLACNARSQLYSSLWDGNAFGAPVLLTSALSHATKMSFDLAEASFATSSNRRPVVDAGPDQTLVFPTLDTALDGRASDDGLPNPPGSVTTAWSLASGPGTAVFDDPALGSTNVRFSAAGTYVLRLTADDGDLTAFDDVTVAIVTTPDLFVNDIAMNSRRRGWTYYGQATVWIKDDLGTDVAGAQVTGQWSGAVTGTATGATGADGEVMLESPGKRRGGTFTFTVTSVVKSGYDYNAALNVETTDSITAPRIEPIPIDPFL